MEDCGCSLMSSSLLQQLCTSFQCFYSVQCIFLFFFHICTLSECTAMEVYFVTFVVCALLFLDLFGVAVGNTLNHSSPFNLHTWDQLLALSHTPLFCAQRLEISKELRRRRRGCRSGVKHRERKRRYKHVYRQSSWGI